jgi:hypothetical protein
MKEAAFSECTGVTSVTGEIRGSLLFNFPLAYDRISINRRYYHEKMNFFPLEFIPFTSDTNDTY